MAVARRRHIIRSLEDIAPTVTARTAEAAQREVEDAAVVVTEELPLGAVVFHEEVLRIAQPAPPPTGPTLVRAALEHAPRDAAGLAAAFGAAAARHLRGAFATDDGSGDAAGGHDGGGGGGAGGGVGPEASDAAYWAAHHDAAPLAAEAVRRRDLLQDAMRDLQQIAAATAQVAAGNAWVNACASACHHAAIVVHGALRTATEARAALDATRDASVSALKRGLEAAVVTQSELLARSHATASARRDEARRRAAGGDTQRAAANKVVAFVATHTRDLEEQATRVFTEAVKRLQVEPDAASRTLPALRSVVSSLRFARRSDGGGEGAERDGLARLRTRLLGLDAACVEGLTVVAPPLAESLQQLQRAARALHQRSEKVAHALAEADVASRAAETAWRHDVRAAGASGRETLMKDVARTLDAHIAELHDAVHRHQPDMVAAADGLDRHALPFGTLSALEESNALRVSAEASSAAHSALTRAMRMLTAARDHMRHVVELDAALWLSESSQQVGAALDVARRALQ